MGLRIEDVLKKLPLLDHILAEARVDLEETRAISEYTERVAQGFILLSTAILGLVIPQFLQARVSHCSDSVANSAWWLVATIATAVGFASVLSITSAATRAAARHQYRLNRANTLQDDSDILAKMSVGWMKNLQFWSFVAGTVTSLACYVCLGIAMWFTSQSVVCIARGVH
jgi:hypothetical protein